MHEQSEESDVALEKIRTFIHNTTVLELLDFTQNITSMAETLGRKLTIEGILPAFPLLKKNSFKVQLALIEQLVPIAQFLIVEEGDEGYQACVRMILPLIEELLYDLNSKVRRATVRTLVLFVELLTPEDRGDHILRFILKLAHEYDDEVARNTALEILNQVAPHLD